MGGSAFVLLMLAELALAMLGFGRTGAQFAASLATAPGLVGLGGQIAFGLMPLFDSQGRYRRN